MDLARYREVTLFETLFSEELLEPLEVGMFAYDAGRYLIQSMGRPFHYHGRDYYWDEPRNYREDQIICSISIDELKNVRYS
ncbi:unnamed protein product [Strongylus vulgaris]|uniref:Uncharacterized protein n=1 Tax=Strongylus vulgaris TaxID=40348 RepID=A0A3P7KF42_STRVU|nr:unnamed protein product [Strongylus vulgaris]